jgi:hypothetical protein
MHVRYAKALEVPRILFTMFGRKVVHPANEVGETDKALAEVTSAIGVGERLCWTRYMLRGVQYEVAMFELGTPDGFRKSYDDVAGVLTDMQHVPRRCRNIACYTLKILSVMQRIRPPPNAYREFYIRIDGLSFATVMHTLEIKFKVNIRKVSPAFSMHKGRIHRIR